MVGALIRMKLVVLRRSLKGPRASLLFWGVAFGLTGAAITIRVGLLRLESPDLRSDLMAAVFAGWLLAWVLGPLLIGGEDASLRPEYFQALPFSTRQLAAGLLGASFIGEIEIICLAAFTGLILYALPLGFAATLIAIPAMALELIFMVLVSRLVTSLQREFVQSQLSALISSLISGVVNAFFITGWALFVQVDRIVTGGFPPIISTILHALPSGWGVVAVQAASQGQWLLAGGALAGLYALILSLRALWAALLGRRLTTKRSHNQPSGRRAALAPRPFLSQAGAVVHKELVTWVRDYTRSSYLYFALFYSLAICLYPVAAHVWILLPWAGVLFVLVVIGGTANLYGVDGSALWLTLTTPGAARYDVRGRQWAWLLLVGPAALLMTLLSIAISGQTWALPWTLALVTAGLGAGAGLVVLNSVFWLIPMTDPQLRGDDLFEHGFDPGQFLLLMFVAAILALPALGIVYLGAVRDLVWLTWAGTAVGLATGVLYAWWFGRVAYRRLEARGPELLHLMRSGEPHKSVAQEGADSGGIALPPLKRALVSLLVLAGCILLFPQGIVPIIFKLIGSDARLWFLALYMPEEYQWLTIIAMMALGLAMFAVAWWIYAEHKKEGHLAGTLSRF